ncbi:GNAT family N-acetyltransferase [Paracoccus onubensis]|nr:GNAT family N-acetyltransferase [Paracoccus onubensis]MDP0928356.1 GNAT family N-acetyltransferase [Paracoccus onubensis]
MTPGQLSALHARCFTIPRPWSADEFAALLETRGCFLLTRPNGFLLGRAIADEAELLTLAVDPATRRKGIGRGLVREFVLAAQAKDAGHLFLEVASDNLPAQALYAALGWQQAGRRPDYYAPGLDALILRLNLPG